MKKSSPTLPNGNKLIVDDLRKISDRANNVPSLLQKKLADKMIAAARAGEYHIRVGVEEFSKGMPEALERMGFKVTPHDKTSSFIISWS